MSRLRVNAFGISIDGYGAGPDQDLANPMGVGGMVLHQWVLGTKTFRKMSADFAGSLIGDRVAKEDIDDKFAARGFANLGAWILGRNMFGPVRGPWSDDDWKGWWGANPPYHVPVFVLTHHARAPLVMEGGTTFHFVTDGIHAALERAKDAAGGKDVRLGGGTATPLMSQTNRADNPNYGNRPPPPVVRRIGRCRGGVAKALEAHEEACATQSAGEMLAEARNTCGARREELAQLPGHRDGMRRGARR